MAPYLLLAAAAAVLGFCLCERRPSRSRDLLLLVLLSSVMLAMSAFRDVSVGVDYEMYLDYYRQVCQGGWGFLLSGDNQYRTEFGYSLLNYLLSFLGPSQVVFSAGIALVCLGLNALFLYRHSPSVWLSLFVFISFGFFGYTLCTLRHQIAIAIFMFALPFLRQKRFWPYLAILLLSASFHKSMLIWIPVFFLAQLPLNGKAFAFYGGCLVLYFLFSEPVLEFITRYVYTGYQPGSYYLQGRDLPTVLIPLVFFAVVLLMRRPLLERDPSCLALINLSFYCACLFIMTLKHFVFQRFALVLLPVSMLLLPQICRILAVPPERQAELESLRAAVKRGDGNKKVNLQRYAALRGQLRERRTMYRASIGFMLFAGFLYLAWLLSANRLLLVPYTLMF